MPPWLLVSPASRGIGLALARKLLRSTSLPLVATARTSVQETRDAILSSSSSSSSSIDESRLHVLQLDVTDEPSIAAAAERCRELFPPTSQSGESSTKPKDQSNSTTEQEPWWLHGAFFLPGVLHPEKSPAQLDEADILHTFRINTIGPLLLLKHFDPFLPRKATRVQVSSEDISGGSSGSGDDEHANDTPTQLLPSTHATVLITSARVGSVTDNTGLGGWYSYRASKAAVNQVVRTYDNHLRRAAGTNAAAIAYHPGTVKTGLSKEFWAGVPEGKLFSPGFAVARMLGVVAGFEGRVEDGRGRCWDWDGKEVPP